MCAYGTLLHPTCGTWPIMCHVYLWGLSPSPSNLWDPMACVSLVLVDPSPSNLWDPMTPFSISIWPMGLDGTFIHLHLTCGDPTVCVTHVPVGPSNIWDLATYVSHVSVGPFSIFIRPIGADSSRVTYCHRGLINSNSKKSMRPESQTRDLEQGIDHLHHCARRLVVLTCLWSSICSLCG
jgi:hypothetical protein